MKTTCTSERENQDDPNAFTTRALEIESSICIPSAIEELFGTWKHANCLTAGREARGEMGDDNIEWKVLTSALQYARMKTGSVGFAIWGCSNSRCLCALAEHHQDSRVTDLESFCLKGFCSATVLVRSNTKAILQVVRHKQQQYDNSLPEYICTRHASIDIYVILKKILRDPCHLWSCFSWVVSLPGYSPRFVRLYLHSSLVKSK